MAKILVGISGGVDSAIAAYLLKQQGHQVVGAFMRNWDSTLSNDLLGNPTATAPICPQEQDYQDAVAVAAALKIELRRVDYIKEYWEEVFTPFLQEYQAGRTPNPDIYCNKHIKFNHFLRYALDNGFDYIATGHYADKVKIKTSYFIKKAADLNKDQSYFLAQLSSFQIEKTLFPLATITKNEVRQIAQKLNLIIAEKKDSTGICFIGERQFSDFLKNYLPLQPGPIIEKESNQILGEHKGAMYYTIGQRKGLGIGGIAGKEAHSYYVVSKDVKNNIVVVSANEKMLLCNKVVLINLNVLMKLDKPVYQAKFRYRQKDEAVTLIHQNEQIIITCLNPTKAVTPGQQAVIYDEGIVVAAGIISEVY